MFPERLKLLRLEANLTQKNIADHFKIKQPTYAQWEQGRRSPSQKTLEKLADFFGVSVDYLLGKSRLKNSNEVDEDALDEAIENSIGYSGKDLIEEDKELIKEALINYLNNQNNK